MASIGDWIKRLSDAKAAFGFIILVGSLLLTIGTSVWTNIGIPARVEALERTTAEHIATEKESTARIYCVVSEIFDYMVDPESGPINPLACEPPGGES